MPKLVDIDHQNFMEEYLELEREREIEETIQMINAGSWGYKVGWYQDKKGSLYHYDGVIWDEVPQDSNERLEYLG
jgi:hypothetical protein